MDEKEIPKTQVTEPPADKQEPENRETPPVTAPDVPDSARHDPSLTVETAPLTPPEPPPAKPEEPGLTFVAAIEPSAEVKDRDTPAPPPTMDRIVEALLFAATSPVPETRLREIVACTPEQLSAVIERLNAEYQAGSHSFRIHRIAQGYQLYTLPEYAEWVGKLLKNQRVQRLSRASLETLSIIAYKQPVTKPEIEQFRGVDSTAPLLTLLERKLVVLAGRAHKPGNPFLYRTSREFLRYFGLGSLDDLPRREELEEFLRHRDLGDQAPGEEIGGVGVPPRPAPAPIPGPGIRDKPPTPTIFKSEE